MDQEASRSRVSGLSSFSSSRCESKDSSRNVREVIAGFRKSADWTHTTLTSRPTEMTVNKGVSASRGLEGLSLGGIN